MNPERFGASQPQRIALEATPSIEAPHFDEEVIERFNRTFDETATGAPKNEEERQRIHNALHKIAEQFQNQHMLQEYEQGKVPTFASMEQAVTLATEFLEQYRDDEEIDAVCKLLSQRVKEIRRWCAKYEQIVVVFQRKKKHLQFKDGITVQEEFVKADTERRRIHENLMGAMRSLDQTLRTANDLETLPLKIGRWDPSSNVPNDFAHTNPLIFSSAAAADPHRDIIRDWALVANLEQKMEAQLNYRPNE